MNSGALKKGIHVFAGMDRFKEDGRMIWGLLPLSNKVSSKDTGGDLYVFEHTNMGKGGPPRHVHFEQDEWFYVIKGEFAFEIGDEKFRLKPGDSLFAPRNVPHGWAHISDQPGTLLTLVCPAGTFETFLRDTTRHANLPTPEEVEKAFEAHGMKVVGPPLEVG
ncbi:MAG: cupin domain-containing protein [Desulfobacteraceae bacterium]|nr:MAG: cupin domain-containing protein [Desulfobacteraceae bacterium]